jgi:hypothetical protein
MSDINYRVKQWQPAPRPEWVRKLNEEIGYLDVKSIIPLDSDVLIAKAKANTGLRDFGLDDWYEPFKILLKSLDEEAELTPIGRIITCSDLLMHLEARLRIEDTYTRHPEINDEQIVSPLFITGSGRTGTSAILNLLSYDPDSGTPKHWEGLFPVPPPEKDTYDSDPRIEKADRRMMQWCRVTPEFQSMHEFDAHIPTEIGQLALGSFQSIDWSPFYGASPTYNEYMAQRSTVPAFNYTRKILKLLQWKNPRKRWLLKSPQTLRWLPDLFSVYPDVELVWMHRDPIKALASIVSVMGTIYWMRSDRKMSEEAIAHQTNPALLAAQFDMVIDQIEGGVLPARQMHHIQYLDFVENPIGTVAHLYQEMGAALTECARSAMKQYLAENPREKRPAHDYSVGESRQHEQERTLFDRYIEYFKIRSET